MKKLRLEFTYRFYILRFCVCAIILFLFCSVAALFFPSYIVDLLDYFINELYKINVKNNPDTKAQSTETNEYQNIEESELQPDDSVTYEYTYQAELPINKELTHENSDGVTLEEDLLVPIPDRLKEHWDNGAIVNTPFGVMQVTDYTFKDYLFALQYQKHSKKNYQEQMNSAINNEQFELAAYIRDVAKSKGVEL